VYALTCLCPSLSLLVVLTHDVADSSDGSNVQLVEDLVREYISKDRAIIVATITCKDDIDNQVSFPFQNVFEQIPVEDQMSSTSIMNIQVVKTRSRGVSQ
jgi:hypothetical protein